MKTTFRFHLPVAHIQELKPDGKTEYHVGKYVAIDIEALTLPEAFRKLEARLHRLLGDE